MAAKKLTPVAADLEAALDAPAKIAAPAALVPVIDLDALIAPALAEAEKNVVVRGTVRLFGKEWRVVEPQNALHSFRMAQLETDPMALIDTMRDCIHPDERSEFLGEMTKAAHLPTEVLLTIVNGVMEVAFARPTSPSSGSSRRSPAKRRSRS